MKKTLEVLNKLVAEKTINDYAIGGAMGAMYYMEAVTTMDLDIFVVFPDETGIIVLSPVYDKLKDWGYLPDPNEKECINIEGTPVQFLPAYSPLLQEALSNSKPLDYNGVGSKVLTAEYLAAVCVDTGRIKDKLRVNMFLHSKNFDREKFEQLLVKYNLKARFDSWKIA